MQAMDRIAAEEKAKLFVPVSIAQYSVYEAMAAERLQRTQGVRYCTADAPTVAQLNDKIKFTELCQHIGAVVPKMFPITSGQQLMELNSRCNPSNPSRF
jgi:carbamoylphosphate synthase large subunit